MKIVSLNIGRSEQIKDYNNMVFMSAIRKKPIEDEVYLSFQGLANDSSYAECHGTSNMALHLFPFEHYAFFNNKAGFNLPIPAFGENLTVSGYSESDANVGDLIAIGDAVVQVTQPTERCKNIGRSLGLPKMLKWIYEEMKTGFYLKVVEEGNLSSCSQMQILDRGPDNLNVARLNRILFKEPNRSELSKVLQSDVLSTEWKERAEVLYGRAGI